METNQIQNFRKYIDIAFRRKAIVIISVMLGICGGLYFYLDTPRVYQATTLLSYQQQKVNPSKLAPDVEARIKDIVSTLSQIVTSRTNLEKIIESIGLYQNARAELPMEDVIEGMRNRIQIEPFVRGDTFRITFSGGNPDKVVQVTNALAGLFIEENLKYREERASETFAYTKDELAMAKEMLDRKEAIMRDYKLKHYNEMPEQEASNVSRLISLQQQYQGRQQSVQDLERTRVLIQDQIAERRKVIGENERLLVLQRSQALDLEPAESLQSQLEKLYAARNALLQKYTDKHPEIKRLNKIIAKYEASVPQGDDGANAGSTSEKVQVRDKVLFDLQIQLKNIALNIQKLEQEQVDLQKRIDSYEEWVANTPIREAEWSALTREYGELKRHYDFLVAQDLQAQSMLNLERKQKGSQFKIEDPARRPEKPIKPDFARMMGMALLLGLGIGGSLAFGIEFLDTSFKDPELIEKSLGIEVICSVPAVKLENEKLKSRIKFIIGALLFAVAMVGIAYLFFYFWQQGRIII